MAPTHTIMVPIRANVWRLNSLAADTNNDSVIDISGDDMTDKELADLNRALEGAWRSVEAGRLRTAQDVISDLRSRR